MTLSLRNKTEQASSKGRVSCRMILAQANNPSQKKNLGRIPVVQRWMHLDFNVAHALPVTFFWGDFLMKISGCEGPF